MLRPFQQQPLCHWFKLGSLNSPPQPWKLTGCVSVQAGRTLPWYWLHSFELHLSALLSCQKTVTRFPIRNKDSQKDRSRTLEDKHVVNKYEKEEQSCHISSDRISPSNREGGGRLLHQSDWREPRTMMMMMIVIQNKRRFFHPSMISNKRGR